MVWISGYGRDDEIVKFIKSYTREDVVESHDRQCTEEPQQIEEEFALLLFPQITRKISFFAVFSHTSTFS